MPETPVLYLWARCSACRNARQALMWSGVAFDERDFFKDRLSINEIRRIVALSSADAVFSWKSPSAEAHRERRHELRPDDLIELMAGEPRLIRRPILVRNGEISIGYPLRTRT